MAQHDYIIANAAGAAFRSDINDMAAAIASQNAGAEPTTKYAYMPWPDTANDLMKQRNAANTAWISLYTLSTGASVADSAAIQLQSATAFTTGGTSTAYTLTPTPALAANTTNSRFRVKFNAAPGASPTLAVSGLAAANLKMYDYTGAKIFPAARNVPANWFSDVEFDGTDWMILNPKQVHSAFSAYSTVAQTNVTGNGVLATVVFGGEVFDKGGDFDGTSTFTAPVTGAYDLKTALSLGDLAAVNTDALLQIVTSNRTYEIYYNPGAAEASGAYGQGSGAVAALADMDAGDTAVIKITVQQGTQIIDTSVGGFQTRFSGYLVAQ